MLYGIELRTWPGKCKLGGGGNATARNIDIGPPLQGSVEKMTL